MLLKRILLALILIAHVGGSLNAQKLEKVTLQLKWQHQFQFAGYYAAQAKGFYKEVGIDVDIRPAEQDKNPTEKVINQEAQFGIGSSDLLLLRSQGVPIVVLASIFQHSPLVLLTLKKDQIQTIHGLANCTIMVENGSAEILAYLKNEGINLANIKQLPHSYNITDLISGKVDAITAYVTTEPFELKEIGYEYITYSPRAVGIDFYSDNLFTTETFLKEKPNLVEKFRSASIKGWYYAMENQEEIIQIIKNVYGSNLTIEHLRFEAKQTEALLQANIVEIGHSNPSRWSHIAEVYTDLGMMSNNIDLNEFIYNPNENENNSRLYLIIIITLVLFLFATLIALKFIRQSIALKNTIKELYKTQKALNMSDSKYRLLIENNSNFIYSLNTDGHFTFVSSVITTKLGYEVSEVIGKNFHFLMHPEDVPLCLSLFHKTLFYGEPQTVLEYRVVTKDGRWLWNTTSLAPLKDENGTITQLIGTASDITEIKMAQLAIQESEAKHRMLTDLSGDMIVMHRNFEKYYVNPAVEKTLGYSQEEFLKLGLLEIIHPDDKNAVEKNIHNDRKECHEKNYNSDFRLKHKDGFYIDFAAHIIVHETKANNFITIINLRNTTQKVKTEREIRKLSTAVNQSPATIVITDINGIIEYVNPHFTIITGYTYEEAIGNNPRILQSNYHPKEFYQEMWNTLVNGHTWSGEIYNKRKDGSCYWEEAIMAPVIDEKGVITNFVAIKNDITQRKNIEIKIKVQNDQLRSLNETKDRFISILAHDLRNPFHTMMGLSQLLKTAIPNNNEDSLELASAIHSTASNTYQLLENLLEWAHVQRNKSNPKLQVINLGELITECITLLHENAHVKKITIKNHIDSNCTLIADSEVFKTIIRNLLVNAIKFSHRGSTVSLKAEIKPELTEISIIDNGVGMSQETVDKLFDLGSAQTSKGTDGEKGTGFGLLICKELVEKHQGSITVKSEINKGTTFTIILPKNQLPNNEIKESNS
ncbi:MAG: PAS domain S-box protein [Breznakibacter sp.]|nr:PAS domain S-box protein [Breznakibacter sp.]